MVLMCLIFNLVSTYMNRLIKMSLRAYFYIGSPFTNSTGTQSDQKAHNFKVRDHASNVLFSTPFTSGLWHNFGVQVDWQNRTLSIFYSLNASYLQPVRGVVPNPSASIGSTGQGDFHFGVLKVLVYYQCRWVIWNSEWFFFFGQLPLINPLDSPRNQADVVHFGIQEGTTEGLLYSGIFVECFSSTAFHLPIHDFCCDAATRVIGSCPIC